MENQEDQAIRRPIPFSKMTYDGVLLTEENPNLVPLMALLDKLVKFNKIDTIEAQYQFCVKRQLAFEKSDLDFLYFDQQVNADKNQFDLQKYMISLKELVRFMVYFLQDKEKELQDKMNEKEKS